MGRSVIGAYGNGSPVGITWLDGSSTNCGRPLIGVVPVPDICNDVIVNSGTPFAPVVNGFFYCRKLVVNTGANVDVVTCAALHIAGL